MLFQREKQDHARSPKDVYVGVQVRGSPRIHAELRARGITSSRKRVAHLMRERGLTACRRHHRSTTTTSEPGARVAPNEARIRIFRRVVPMRSGLAISLPSGRKSKNLIDPYSSHAVE